MLATIESPSDLFPPSRKATDERLPINDFVVTPPLLNNATVDGGAHNLDPGRFPVGVRSLEFFAMHVRVFDYPFVVPTRLDHAF